MAGRSSDAVEGLLLVVDSENTEDDRYVTFGIEMCDSLGDTLTDIIKMRCSPADYTAQNYDSVRTTATRISRTLAKGVRGALLDVDIYFCFPVIQIFCQR